MMTGWQEDALIARIRSVKAETMRACIEETAKSFEAEGNTHMADQTRNATADADDATLARLHDLLQKTTNRDEAIMLIQRGEA